jgi:ribosomal protein L37AE/L43A
MIQTERMCDACGEEDAVECIFPPGLTLWLCDACGCGYTGGGDETQEMIEQSIESIPGIDSDEVNRLRERILQAHERTPLRVRGAKVAGMLASMN